VISPSSSDGYIGSFHYTNTTTIDLKDYIYEDYVRVDSVTVTEVNGGA